ncbi:MAG: family 1 glycosylhydrolase [Candidatus Rehaiarchaeum fermentans]|nr:family 1 glycosylhydrolase [Candidatus Rehaiarchaeum fermentans]
MYIGVSTSAYQNEEGCFNSDWYHWEKLGKVPKKGDANKSYKEFKKDIDLLKELGVNAYRFSIEFSRIMPKKNKVDNEAINHYKELIRLLKENNIEPFVTLWHYTLPYWIEEENGLESNKIFSYFMDYVKTLIYNEVLEGVKYIITLNEPSVVTLFGYLFGIYPPKKKNLFSYLKSVRNIIKLHNILYSFLSEQGFKVSYAQNFSYYTSKLIIDYPLSLLLSYITEYNYLDEMKKDFVSINYYGKIEPLEIIGRKGINESRFLSPKVAPEGLEVVLRDLHYRYNLPIVITENGISTKDENKRIKYIKDHIDIVKKFSIKYRVSGYFYWTLEDNYEWTKGYTKTFGLFDRKRRPKKESVNFFKEEIKELKDLPNWI